MGRLILSLVAFVLISFTSGQTFSGVSDESGTALAHNNYRRAAVNGQYSSIPQPYEMNDFAYNNTLEAAMLSFYNNAYSGGCSSTSMVSHSGQYWGENIYAADPTANIAGATAAWWGEISSYTWGSGFSGSTGHFTQVAWAASTTVACITASCGMQNIVCGYYPPGNFNGANPYVPASNCNNMCSIGCANSDNSITFNANTVCSGSSSPSPTNPPTSPPPTNPPTSPPPTNPPTSPPPTNPLPISSSNNCYTAYWNEPCLDPSLDPTYGPYYIGSPWCFALDGGNYCFQEYTSGYVWPCTCSATAAAHEPNRRVKGNHMIRKAVASADQTYTAQTGSGSALSIGGLIGILVASIMVAIVIGVLIGVVVAKKTSTQRV